MKLISARLKPWLCRSDTADLSASASSKAATTSRMVFSAIDLSSLPKQAAGARGSALRRGGRHRRRQPRAKPHHLADDDDGGRLDLGGGDIGGGLAQGRLEDALRLGRRL